MSITAPVVSALSLGILTASGIAWAAPVRCPAELKVEQTARDLPAHMAAFETEARHVWVNAQFSDGPPADQAWLAPDSTRKHGKSFTNTWRFTPSGPGTFISCGYSGTSLVLSVRLAPSIRSCEVRYNADAAPSVATAVDCR